MYKKLNINTEDEAVPEVCVDGNGKELVKEESNDVIDYNNAVPEVHYHPDNLRIKKIAIVGLGAVGAVAGSQLISHFGNHLYCVMDEERVKKYSKKGVFVNKERQPFNFVTPEEVPVCDLIIIATKNLQLKTALEEIENAVGEHTMILSLLNGLDSEAQIEKKFGAEKTLYGFIIGLTSVNEGGEITVSSKGTIYFGEKDNSRTERIKDLIEVFRLTGIDHKNPADIHFEMWKKFLINVTFNSIGAITESTYGGYGNLGSEMAARKIGLEVIKVAKAEGILLPEELLEQNIEINRKLNPYSKCSMVQDVENHRKTENEYFCGKIMSLAEKHGIEVPYCTFLYELLSGKEYAWKFNS